MGELSPPSPIRNREGPRLFLQRSAGGPSAVQPASPDRNPRGAEVVPPTRRGRPVRGPPARRASSPPPPAVPAPAVPGPRLELGVEIDEPAAVGAIARVRGVDVLPG